MPPQEAQKSPVVSSPDGTVKVCDANPDRCLKTFGYYTASVTFSPDGTYLAAGTYDTYIDIRDAKNFQFLQRLEGQKADVCSVQISPDNKRLVSGATWGNIKIWDSESWECIKTLEVEGSTWMTVARFSPNGEYLASYSGSNTFKIWDAKTYETFMTFQIWNAGLCAEFSLIADMLHF